MTTFAMKSYVGLAELRTLQERIEGLSRSLDLPHDLMMFSIDAGGIERRDIYVGLPSSGFLSAFPGFAPIDRESLPDFLTTLYARDDGFEERFPDIFSKRRSR